MKFRVIALSPADYGKWLENQKTAARTATAAVVAADAEKPHVSFASLKNPGPGDTFAGSPAFDADPFAAWKKLQSPDAGENAAQIAAGRKLFQEKTCVKCHTIRGHEAGGVTAPDLTHIGARSTIAAGVLENTPEHLHLWIKNPEYFKPGNKMFHGVGRMEGYVKQDADGNGTKDANGEYVLNFTLSDGEIDALVAYLRSLK